jgi:5S rRNA maturation endonuclease (ribonuclease M5)
MVVECPLAPWKHSNPADEAKRPSTVILLNPFGQSSVFCNSTNCAYKGSLYYILWRAIHYLPAPTPGDLKFLEWVNEREKDDIEALSTRFAESALKLSSRETRFAASAADLKLGSALLLPVDVFRHEEELLDEVYLDQFHFGIPIYVTERGIKVETAKRWGLRYDKRLQRVVFPVRRMDGRLVGCSGRIIPAYDVPNRDGDPPLRYYNYCGLNKMRYLYGANLFKLGKPVVVTEGQFDGLKTSQALGEDVNVSATLGHGFSEDHRKTIASAQPEAIYLFPDNDVAGKKAAEMIASKLKSVAPLFLMRVTQGKDPGGMLDDSIRGAFASAEPVLDGYIQW